MRMLGLILALGAMVWVMYQAAGGGEAETVIPQGHQKALDKAKNLESVIAADMANKLESEQEQ